MNLSIKYIDYTVEDFVKDEYFQKWVLDTDVMTSKFWNNWCSENPHKETVINEAKSIIQCLDFDDEKLSDADFDYMWQQIIEGRRLVSAKINRGVKRKSKRLFWTYAAAASIVLIVSLSLLLTNENNSQPFIGPTIVNNQIKSGSTKATLTLNDGSNIFLEKGKNYTASNVTSNGEEISYQSRSKKDEKIAYNYLTIPRGGQFSLKLSDGTEVWLNSETQIKYPVSFKEGETRKVELVYGEAYFDVTPSTANNGANFKVFNQSQEIEVLGTEFNIKAYKDESIIYTTLVEGKVKVTTEKDSENLSPNQQTKVDPLNKKITVLAVDVYNEISWKEGVFSFDDKTLKEIMTVLSRWYDMEVEFINPEIENDEFIGSLDRTQHIEGVLEIIKSFGVINNYEIINKKVLLN